MYTTIYKYICSIKADIPALVVVSSSVLVLSSSGSDNDRLHLSFSFSVFVDRSTRVQLLLSPVNKHQRYVIFHYRNIDIFKP